jgi:aryl carrier-like protein
MHLVRDRDLDRERVPIGVALPGVTSRVCDQDGRTTADGVAGELHLSGAGVSRGYAGDPGSTAARFHDHEGERCYRSGDLAVVNADGLTEFLGRVDRQVKIRGHRVEPAVIEAELIACPGVTQSLVAAERPVADEPLELVAYVVGTATQAEALDHLRSRLAASHVPSAVHVVDRILMTPNGKADLAALKHLVARRTRGSARAEASGRRAPRTETERIVTDAWCAALKLSEVDLDAKFVDLGGDSFKSLAVFGRLRRHFPGITIAQLFEHPTVATLAKAVSGAGPVAEPAAMPAAAIEF